MKDYAVNRLSRENSEIGAQEPRSLQLLAIQPRTMAQAFAIAAVMALTLTPITGAQAGAGSKAPVQTPQSQSAAAPAEASKTATTNEPKMTDVSAAPAESLGDAARKARAQKAKAPGDATASTTQAKVYTDDSVRTLSGHGVSFVGSSSGGGDASASAGNGANATAPGANGAAPRQGQSEEAYWRGRANDIRKQMGQIDDKIARVQDDIAKNGAVSIDPQSGAQQGVIMVEDRNMEIKRLNDQKAELQKQLDELAEEGRKAGADSGWFR
jgi:hypothetical protein